MKPPVLIISGLDPSGDAGFLADARTVSFLGGRPVGVIAAMTVQNKDRFVSQSPISYDLIKEQLTVILEDIQPKAVKIGMLGRKENINIIVDILNEHIIPNVVLDPVLRSSTGGWLLPEKDLPSLRDRLIPKALIITPNVLEARTLMDVTIFDEASAETACKDLTELGAPGVVRKGGHLQGKPIDTFHFLGETVNMKGKRMEGNFHGTGCLFSSAMATFLALGEQPVRAFKRTHRFLQWMISRHEGSWDFPKGGKYDR